MVYITFVICILLLVISLQKNGNCYNPLVIFYALWTMILFFNMIGIYGLNKSSQITYIYIIVGLISLFAGGVFGQVIPKIILSYGKRRVGIKKTEMRYKVVYTLMIIATVFLLLDVLVVVKALINGNTLTAIRTWYTATYSSGNNPIEARRGYIEQVFRVLVTEPFMAALPVLCAIELFGKRKNKKFVVMSIGLLIMSTLASGGARLSILLYALTFIAAFCIYRRNKIIDKRMLKKYKKMIIVFVIIGMFVVIYLTSKRSSTNFLEEVYYYFAMCVPLLDRWVPYIQNSPHTFGMLSFFGIVRIPFLIAEKLGINILPIYELAKEYILQANYFYDVGERIGNSFVSPFYYLYLDAGVFGIILGMFTFGYIGIRLYKRVYFEADKKDVYFLLLFIQAAFMTFVRWQFIGTAYMLCYIYAFIYFRSCKEE